MTTISVKDAIELISPHGNIELLSSFTLEGLLKCRLLTTDIEVLAMEYERDNMIDFVYDFRSGVIMIDTEAAHEVIRTHLYTYYTGDYSMFTSEAADHYILKNMGIFKSSVGRCVMHGPNMSMHPRLWKAFRRDLLEIV